MKHLLISFIVAIFTLGVFIPEAEARRFGGGGSFGMQRQATPQQAPRQPAAQPPRPAQQAAGTQAGQRSWMGPIAGLAAGLGLAALFSHLGLGEELGSLLLIGLLVFGAVMLFRILSRRASGAQAGNRMQYAAATPGRDQAHAYAGMTGSSAGDPSPGSASSVSSASPVYADFDAEGFARQAKLNFIRLQAAHDEGNLDDIRTFTTPEMFAEISLQIGEHHVSGQRTDVVDLNAEVIEVTEDDLSYIVSVRFNGLIREDKDAAPAMFDEVWHLTKGKNDSRGWVISGIQQVS